LRGSCGVTSSIEFENVVTFDGNGRTFKAHLTYRYFTIQECGNQFEHSKVVDGKLESFTHASITQALFSTSDAFLSKLDTTWETASHLLTAVRAERALTNEGVCWEAVTLPKLNLINQMIKDE
jgi:hypothetical protein